MKYSAFVCSLVVCGLFGMFSADVAHSAARQQAPQAPALRPSNQAVNKIVAVVNGEMITAFDLEMAATPDVMQAGLDPRKPAQAEKINKIMRKTLDAMITDQIVVQEAMRLGVNVSESDIDAELKIMVERSKLSEEEFLRQIALQGMTKEKVRERLRNRLLQQRLMGNMVGRKVVVSKDEVAAYFAAQGNSISTSPLIDLALLIYHPQAPAETLAGYIREGKAPFEEVVKRASVGPRREEGGRIDAMKLDDMNAELRAAVDAAVVGKVSKIFTMDGHKAQIKVFARKDGQRFTTLESATPLIEERLRAPKVEERYQEYLGQLRKKARIEIRM